MMGLDGKDIFVQIKPDGEVKYSYRMTLTFYCWMNLKKFPFDYQICGITWISCTLIFVLKLHLQELNIWLQGHMIIPI